MTTKYLQTTNGNIYKMISHTQFEIVSGLPAGEAITACPAKSEYRPLAQMYDAAIAEDAAGAEGSMDDFLSGQRTAGPRELAAEAELANNPVWQAYEAYQCLNTVLHDNAASV